MSVSCRLLGSAVSGERKSCFVSWLLISLYIKYLNHSYCIYFILIFEPPKKQNLFKMVHNNLVSLLSQPLLKIRLETYKPTVKLLNWTLNAPKKKKNCSHKDELYYMFKRYSRTLTILLVHTIVQLFGVAKLFNVFERSLLCTWIKNTLKIVILWNSIRITVFYFNIFENIIYFCTFSAAITPVFSVTWFFRNHSMLICFQETFLLIINVKNSCVA